MNLESDISEQLNAYAIIGMSPTEEAVDNLISLSIEDLSIGTPNKLADEESGVRNGA